MRSDGMAAVLELLRTTPASAGFVLTGHAPLDGDGLGSALGLARSLRLAGRRTVVASHEPVPKHLMWLPGAPDVVAWQAGDYGRRPELDGVRTLLCFDSGDTTRLGGPYDERPPATVVVNVDHHVTNTGYGHVNWVEPEAPSVGAMVYALVKAGGFPVDADVALPLYLSLVEDTGRFSYSNTTPAALRAGAEMVEAGASPERITNELFRNEPLATMRLRARCVERLQVSAGGRLATTYVTHADLDELGLRGGDEGRDMVEVAIGLEGVEVGVLLRQLPPGEGTKLSFRSKSDFDVAALCVEKGGGGHKKAAGCRVRQDDVVAVRDAIAADVSSRLAAHPRP